MWSEGRPCFIPLSSISVECAEGVIHSRGIVAYQFSCSFSGSCEGCRNSGIIICIIPSNGGNETAFVPYSRQAWTVLFYQPSHLSRGCQDVSAEVAPGCSHGGTQTATYPGYPHTAEILWLGNFSPRRAQHVPTPLKTSTVPYLGKDRQEMQTADGRELNSDWGETQAPQNWDLFLATCSWKALRYQQSLLIHQRVLSKLVTRLMFSVLQSFNSYTQHLAWIGMQNLVARSCFSSLLDHFADRLAWA